MCLGIYVTFPMISKLFGYEYILCIEIIIITCKIALASVDSTLCISLNLLMTKVVPKKIHCWPCIQGFYQQIFSQKLA